MLALLSVYVLEEPSKDDHHGDGGSDSRLQLGTAPHGIAVPCPAGGVLVLKRQRVVWEV